MSKSNVFDNKKSQRFNYRLYLAEAWIKVKDALLHKSKQQIKDYFESSSINCYQYVVDDTMKKWERLMWRILHVCAFCIAIWVMWVAGGDAIINPAIISRAPIEASLDRVEYPGIALCNLNRISKTKANNLAAELIANQKTNKSIDKMVESLGYLGFAYDLELPDSDQLEELHDILSPYNLNDLLKNLTPSCDEILKRCMWRNNIVNCSEYFSLRKTMDGYCCTFNYRKKTVDSMALNSTDKNSNSTKKKQALPGQERGLSVLIDPELDDYHYARFPHAGLKIFIFSPNDYPDVTSGGCIQQNMAPSTELYLVLDAILITATDDIRQLSLSSRGCLFEDNSDTHESYSDCIVNCRTNSIKAACGCIPFFLPSSRNDKICDLTDNICLAKWKDSWWDAWSGEESLLESGEIAGLAKEPPCSHCIPACEDYSYEARQHAVALQPNSINFQPDSEKIQLKRGVTFKDHCVIHIYFSKDTVVNLVRGLMSPWYNLLSTLGGICGLVLGASLISIAEIIFYIFGGPVTKSRHRRQVDMRQLYWEELRNYRRI